MVADIKSECPADIIGIRNLMVRKKGSSV